jgi:hypothetical protein
MVPAEKVALLALVYAQLYMARHSDPDNLLEDFEVCRGEVTLAAMIGSQAAEPFDWFLIRAMDDPAALRATARDVAEVDPLRAEALLHAWPPEADGPNDAWALRYGGERWTQVEQVMEQLRADGLTTSREDVNAIACRAYAEAVGVPFTVVLDGDA